jgi:hypothetical protein
MGGRRARWLVTGVASALVGAMLQAGGPVADASVAASQGGGLKVTAGPSVETLQGIATTLPLPGGSGNYLRVNALGAVGVSAQDGHTVWQLSASSLFSDWHLRLVSAKDGPVTPDPQVPLVRLSPNPFRLSDAQQHGIADVHPVAAGYLAGSRAPVVAVAETAGAQPGSVNLQWPFNVPGSHLHEGTFVTLLNGSTGQYLYSQLYPGQITQLAITGGKLIVGEETGDPSGSKLGAWRSSTQVQALTFHQSGSGLAASTAWTYSTGAPWAALLDMQVAGPDIALDWSDTPLGLGVPGPPDGHVVLIAPDGHVRWNVTTPGYPVLSAWDASRGLLAVAEETDPNVAIGYNLVGMRPSNGSVAVSAQVGGVLPTALAVSSGTGHGSSWLTGGVNTTQRMATGQNFEFTSGQVTDFSPASGHVLWSSALTAKSKYRAPYPASVLPAANTVLVGSGTYLLNHGPTTTQPYQVGSDLRALSGADGHMLWHQAGDIADALSLHLAGTSGQPVVTGVTDEQDAVSYDASTGAVTGVTALMSDMDAGVQAEVGGQRAFILGSQSGGVYAVAASDFSHILWQADAGGPVHQLVLASPGGGAPPVVVAAATNRVDVLNVNTGAIQVARDYPGQYVWNVAVGKIGSHRAAVAVATDHLSTFDAATGGTLWTYKPPVAAYFSDAAIVGGVTVAEYQNQVPPHGQPTTMAAVGVGAHGKVAWTAPASTSTTSRAVLWNGVFASPQIPGGGPDGVAFTWQDTSGAGQVDVRNAVTGALMYSDVSDALFGERAWAVDPGLGLLSIGQGSVLIQPSGATGLSEPQGTGGAVVESGGQPVLLTANNEIRAYPAGTAAGLQGGFAASNNTFMPGTLVPAGPASGGQVLALPEDLLGYQVVYQYEQGQFQFPFSLNDQIGADLLTVSGTPPAAVPAQPKAPAAHQARTANVTVGSPARPHMGTAAPQLELHVRGHKQSGAPVLAQTTPAGYDPATMRAYLGLTGDGAGQTVAVVDAYRDPNIASDVNTFSSQFGLPQVCGTAGAGKPCFNFKVTAPQGTAGQNADWALETSLDVEWIHAIAPKAAVRLVTAHDASFASMWATVTDAAALSPAAISISWGDSAGEFSGETFYDWHCQLAHSICVAATGDFGHPGQYPAYNSRALAVGGTTLQLGSGGTVDSEVAWASSGGGLSYFEPKPAAQRDVSPGGHRGIPDVSFNADPNTGVAVYDSVPYEGQAGWFVVGGTSAGAPSWSAILADADQLRVAAGKSPLTSAGDEAQRAVYAATANLGDITTGPPNGPCPSQCQAGTGYDFVTGLGSPRAGLDQALAAAP